MREKKEKTPGKDPRRGRRGSQERKERFSGRIPEGEGEEGEDPRTVGMIWANAPTF